MTESLSEVVRAKRFELVDYQGNVRATLALHEDESPGLDLWDKEGHRRATMLLDRQGLPQLVLWSKGGTVRGRLEFGSEWKLGLTLTDMNEQVIWSAVHEGL